MQNWLTETSNFILIFLLGLYVLTAYLTMWTRQYEVGFTRCMAVCRYLLHGYSFLILIVATKNTGLIPFYLLQVAFFVVADILQKKLFRNHIRMLYQNMMLLLSIGMVVLTRLSMNVAVKQFIMAVLAFAVSMLIPPMLRIVKQLEKLWLLYLLAGVGLLLVVLVMGSDIFGARNWLTIRNFTFQPSEFVKLLYILSLASLLVRKTQSKYSNLLLVSIVAAVHVGLLALSNDFGGALIYFSIYVMMLFVVSRDVLFPIAACMAGTLAAWLAYFYSGHIRDRVLAWKDPFACIEDEGYQIAQSYFAIGSGGWFGTGLGEGMQETVPVVKSDFIFSAISEEYGAIFAVLLLAVFLNCMIWMLLLALDRKEPFYFAVTTGAVVMFGIQTFLNVGGVIKLIPSTGVTLFFVSYGGSSLMSTIFLFQGIQGMCYEEKKKGKGASKKKFEDRQHIRLLLVTSILILLLSVTMAYFLTTTVRVAGENYENPYNRRIERRETKMKKGTIYSSDGKILAQTVEGADGELYRVYPYGAMTAFVTGRSSMGRTGLEADYYTAMFQTQETELEQLSGRISGEIQEGNGLVTTVDMELQKIAWESLEGYRGAVVAVDVKTGRILSMVSTPAYNPNEIGVVWDEVLANEDSPLFNRVLQGLYPPGSTFKTVTTLAYLSEHAEEDFSHTCMGTDRIAHTDINCYDLKAHGTQNLLQAFVNSCNTAYATMGTVISDEAYQKVSKRLGFGTVWERTLPYAADSFVITEETEDAARAQATFGQGEVLMTPYHAVMLTAAIANDGVLKLPYLVESMVDKDGTVLETYSSAEELALLSKEEADLLTEYMVAASASRMSSLAEKGITVAGKTGSAEFAKETPAHSWYWCFAPAEDPQIAIAVIVEEVGTGSAYALPVARKMLEAYFQ